MCSTTSTAYLYKSVTSMLRLLCLGFTMAKAIFVTIPQFAIGAGGISCLFSYEFLKRWLFPVFPGSIYHSTDGYTGCINPHQFEHCQISGGIGGCLKGINFYPVFFHVVSFLFTAKNKETNHYCVSTMNL